MSPVDSALRDLLAALDEDHRRIALVVLGEQALPPVDHELAALAHELRRLRWMEPDAPAMALLADAARRHADAVERHLAWLAASAPAPVVALPDVPRPVFRLAS